MDELTGDFVAETRDMLDALGDALLVWEADPADMRRLDEIFRFVHTVKGSCGFLDLPRIASLAHGAETALAAARAGTRTPDAGLVGAIIGLVDRIAHLTAALDPVSQLELPPIESDCDLIEALERPRSFAATATTQNVPTRSVRVAVPLLEAMMAQVSDLVLVRNDLARAVAETCSEDDAIRRGFDRISAIVGDLRDSVTQTRMQPIDRLFSALPRLVRDTANALGKSVVLEIAGADVEIDREMVEAIRDPLIHIVRNAIDHGIEAPEVRVANGKPRTGTLRIAAHQSGNQVGIEVTDDGRGIDIATLVARAIDVGVIDAVRAALLDGDTAAQLVFAAGLSTRSEATDVSGRGVGMDIVRANVERLGGTVALTNRPGQGLTITLRAPLTLSIVTALTLNAGGQRFAISRGAVEEVVSLHFGKARLETIGGGMIAVVRDQVLPAFALADLLELEPGEPTRAVVVATTTGQRYVIAVEDIGDPQELVIRALAPVLSAVGPFAGQSLGNDGQPLTVLDPVALADRAGVGRVAIESVSALGPAEVPSVLLATDTAGRRIAVRALLVDRLLEIEADAWMTAGARWFVRIDGTPVPVAAGHALKQSAGPAAILCDGVRQIVLPLCAIDDLRPMPIPVPVGTAGVEALLNVDGVGHALLDGLSLFEGVERASRDARPRAAIELDATPWAHAMLAPMLTAAGYDVRFGTDAAAALTVRLEGESGPDGAIELARGPSGGVAVERYDRATLTALVDAACARAA